MSTGYIKCYFVLLSQIHISPYRRRHRDSIFLLCKIIFVAANTSLYYQGSITCMNSAYVLCSQRLEIANNIEYIFDNFDNLNKYTT